MLPFANPAGHSQEALPRRIDSFVFNWLDYAPAAEQLERALQPLSSADHLINCGQRASPQGFFI